jgi:uncharacterized membrane protein
LARGERLTIESNRSLGGIGACFVALGVINSVIALFQYAFSNSLGVNLALTGVSSIIAVLAFVGFILFLISMYGFSKDYQDEKIFNYILYGLIITIVAAIVAVIIAFFVIFTNLVSMFPSLSSSTASSSQIMSSVVKSLVPILPIFGVIMLIWVVFNVRAFNLLADKSKVPLFRTAATVLLAGALLTIVLGIIFAAIAPYVSISYNTLLAIELPGGIVQEAAWVLLAIAYFRIKAPAVAPLTVPTVTGQVKYCPNCGASNQTDAMYCTRCGQKI